MKLKKINQKRIQNKIIVIKRIKIKFDTINK